MLLKNKYIMANDELDYTFHSVILAGVHDCSNYTKFARDLNLKSELPTSDLLKLR
jgi:hypothetical protein